MEFALQHNFLMAEMAKLPPRFFRPTRSCNYSGVVCINVFFFLRRNCLVIRENWKPANYFVWGYS
jgi:hypothetical protein